MMMSGLLYEHIRNIMKKGNRQRTYFIPHGFVRKCASRRFAEKDNSPLPSLSQFQTLIVYLMR